VCDFCDIAAGSVPAAVVLDRDEVLAFLDHRPLFEGHCLLIPKEHHETLTDLPAALIGPLFMAARALAQAMEEGLGSHGSFVAMNNRVSQSVAHFHVHVVPRRRKDGLRGFFWPRRRYDDDAHMAETARRLKQALAAAQGSQG
jgi:histidine triad (HIT) family protein